MEILAGLRQVADAVTNYMLPLAAASGLTVALLEAFKKLFSIRGSFHRRAVARWLAENHRKVETVGFNPVAIMHGVTHYDVSGSGKTAGARGASFAAARQAYEASKAQAVDELRQAQEALKQHDASQSGALGAVHTRNDLIQKETRASGRLEEVEREAPSLGNYSADQAYQELKLLTTGVRQLDVKVAAPRHAPFRSIERAVFELEIARMMAQIQDAADAVLQNPHRSPSLYLFLTRGCEQEDVTAWSTAMATRPTEPDPARQARMAELYGRIRLLVKRQLDSFQTVTSYRWDELNQLWAIIVGAIILYVAQLTQWIQSGDPAIHRLSLEHLKIACVSLLGGVLAPIAKDLISALSNIKFTKS